MRDRREVVDHLKASLKVTLRMCRSHQLVNSAGSDHFPSLSLPLSLVAHWAEELRSSLWVWFQFLENEEVVRREEKNSRLVNPLLLRVYQKSSFNSTVCVGSPLNARLYNPFRRPGLSCTNKQGNGSPHIQQRDEAKNEAPLRPNLFQMAPRDDIIYIGCVRFPRQRRSFAQWLVQWPKFLVFFFLPGPWLAQTLEKIDLPYWRPRYWCTDVVSLQCTLSPG